MTRVIPINLIAAQAMQPAANKGWQECQDCEYADSDTCDFCEDADQYEPAYDQLAEAA